MHADISFPTHRDQQHFGFGCMMRGLDVEARTSTTVNVTYGDVNKVADLILEHHGDVTKVYK